MLKRPQYKTARRLGAPIFAKTQTQKYSQWESKKKGKEGRRSTTDFGIQMLEKQKARFTYGISEKQFANYVGAVSATRAHNKAEALFAVLEERLDNVVFRAGLAGTRRAARQMVSHGHIYVNGRKTTIPSQRVEKGDVITVKPGSAKKVLFANIEEKTKDQTTPSWMIFDPKKLEIKIQGTPKLGQAGDNLFDLNAVLEFYSR